MWVLSEADGRISQKMGKLPDQKAWFLQGLHSTYETLLSLQYQHAQCYGN